MDKPQKTTAFSAHLSWAAMRRFLQEQLTPEASQRVESHLRNCPRCSSAIIDYIQSEEPQHYKRYMKKLKGNLTSSQTAKKRFFSAFQLKAIRTTIAVITLLVFSFFAIKTVINQSGTERMLPSESLASTTQKIAKSPTVRRKASNTPKAKPTHTKEASQKVARKVKKATEKPAVKKAEKPRTSPAPQTAAASPKDDKQPKARPDQAAATPQTTDPSSESVLETKVTEAHPAIKSVASSSDAKQETTGEESVQKAVKAEPIPTVKTSDIRKEAPSVAPLGRSQPATLSAPTHQIRER